ncbi:hypothetical protein X566_02395 [Afipia sp. P52-10]|jgi:uncharacterized protein (DUF2267 family)|uniref:DUF2267 domain-containing protein n=1 Tax=Afipia sp. P52-10 TaxID=1429916 RepID=UPI0003DF3DEC|nr:DUF2267 domain-containing protein [Afipia sp. P52-10]ETR76609.1 hypothetical protein X566_02395 [Afipia sp. P52-10]
MSASGLDVFDKTLQTTHIWLKEIETKVGPDRQVAWKVLSVVLHKLRDRLPVDLAAHLGAELPLLIRGVYYDQYEPAKQPAKWNRDEFVAEVQRWLSDIRPVAAPDAIDAVFGTLSHYVSPGQIEKVKRALPDDIQACWTNGASIGRPRGETTH